MSQNRRSPPITQTQRANRAAILLGGLVLVAVAMGLVLSNMARTGQLTGVPSVKLAEYQILVRKVRWGSVETAWAEDDEGLVLTLNLEPIYNRSDTETVALDVDYLNAFCGGVLSDLPAWNGNRVHRRDVRALRLVFLSSVPAPAKVVVPVVEGACHAW